nr:hypothetical protein [Tanacetum cinerariifolium]
VNDVTRLQALVDQKKVVVTEAAIRESVNPYHQICFTYPDTKGQEIEKEGDADEHVEDVQQTPPQSPQVQPPSPKPQAQQQAADFPMSLLQEALDACTALTRRVKHLKYDKVAQALEITKLKRRVKRLEKGNKARVLKLRRMIDEMDKDDAVVLMNEKEEDKKVEEAKEDELAEVQEVVDVVTTAMLITEVVTAATKTVTAASAIISAAEPQVPAATITDVPTKFLAAPSRRRKGVVIRDPEEESTTSSIISTQTKSKDKGKGIMVEEPKPLKKKQQIEMDEEYARKLHVELNEDIDWDVAIDHVKLKAIEDPAVQRYHVMKRKP